MTFVVIVLCLLGMCGEAQALACDAEDNSDQHSLLVLRTGLEAGVTVPKPENRCAVCLSGELRNLNETSEALNVNLFEALASEGAKVDVFVAGPPHGPFGIADFALPDRASTNGESHRVAIRNVSFKEEPSVAAYSEMLAGAPKEATELYKTGKFHLGPVDGDNNVLRIYHHDGECLQMMQQSEKDHHIRYEWVVRSRPDFMWLTPHPPLSALKADMLWTFDTEHYLFMNDRHVAGGHDVMFDAFLNRMNILKTGDPVIYKDAVNNGSIYGGLGDEGFSQLVADAKNIHVAQMPTLAFLGLCPSWSLHCTRYDHSLYGNEVKYAKSYQALWTMPNSCWAQTSYDRINISHNC